MTSQPQAAADPATISVALCTRNGAAYLPAQVRSICQQDRAPIEIVLSDDGSRDDSVELVRTTMADCGAAGRIALTVFRNDPALGVTRNFEQAVMACRGTLIALCDQDDVWRVDRLATMAAVFERRPALLLLHTDARLVDGDLQPLGQTLFQGLEVRADELAGIHAGRAFGVLMHRNLVTGATTLFRRRLLDVALPFAAQWVHDEWLAALAAATGEMDVLEDCLIDYRQHASNQIGVRRLGLKAKIAKAFAPRGDKHAQRLVRAQVLLDRLQSLGGQVPAQVLAAAREKVAHQRFRAQLPAPRLLRPLPIAIEALRGRYARYDRGWQAIVQDLLEG
ncbi:glycosyltransferase family 2 protein [Xenophilus aerolatus]|nr:glycosyltransferase family 2 protein [Xenophilus aerolatus]